MIEFQLLLLTIIAFYIGLFVGFLLKVWLNHRASYDGTVVIIKDSEKILYSLELNENPEMIEFKKELILKVKTSETES